MSVRIIEVIIQGPQGPTGPPGIPYEHTQLSPVSTWDVQHNLGAHQNVTLLDDDGVEYFARILQDTPNHLFVFHNSPRSGKAVLG